MNYTNINSIQLRRFQVILNTNQFVNEPIENIRELSEIVRIYNTSIISSIIFYFYDVNHQDHYLILRNTQQNNIFIVEFYHYYDRYIQRVELSREEQITDFTTVINYLNSNQTLSRSLVHSIINPFHIPQIMT
jgi:hypothetical protein